MHFAKVAREAGEALNRDDYAKIFDHKFVPTLPSDNARPSRLCLVNRMSCIRRLDADVANVPGP